MKNKIFLSTCVLLMICLSSCDLDNYKAPDAQFFGSVIDSETNEPILQDLYNGSRIDFRELAYKNSNTRQIPFYSDGTFRENNLFSGIYEVQALRGNFFPSEILTMNINGATEYHFRTLPYIRIRDLDVSFDEIRGVVTSTFKLEQVATNPVASVALYADRSVHLSNNLFEMVTRGNVGSTVDPEQTFKLEMSTENLISGKDYYFKVGALISGIDEAKHNYSQAIRLPIDNSNVIPDIPIPGKVIEDCESLDGWITVLTAVSLDDSDKKEGNYSLKVEGNNPELFLVQKVFAPFDTEVTRENGYLAFDLYVNDVSLFGSLQRIDLTSSDNGDFNAITWNLPEIDLVNGWNKVELPLIKNNPDWNTCNLSAVSFFRFVDIGVKGDLVLKFDNIRFYSK